MAPIGPWAKWPLLVTIHIVSIIPFMQWRRAAMGDTVLVGLFIHRLPHGIRSNCDSAISLFSAQSNPNVQGRRLAESLYTVIYSNNLVE